MSKSTNQPEAPTGLIFATAKYKGPIYMGGYTIGKTYSIAYKHAGGEVHIMHVPSTKVKVIYKDEADFLNHWEDIVQAPPFPKEKK